MTQAEREILEGRSKCAFEVIKQLQKRCFLLRGEVKRLREENERLKSELDGCDDCLKEWEAVNSS